METTAGFQGLACTACDATVDATDVTHRCPDCGGALAPAYDLDAIDLSPGQIESRPFSGIDRYAELLPFPAASLVTMDEGTTPLVACPALADAEFVGECYVKDDEGVFHSYVGMIDQFTVTEQRSGTEPEATLDLSLSTDGIDVTENVQPGQQTVAVTVADQQIYDHLLGHDVHLVRLNHRTSIDAVNGWMNWMDPAQLVSDGTEPGTFLGGVQTIVTPELLEGAETKTAYFDVNLNPGAYAWVSEVPTPAEQGLLKPFIVTFE